MVLCVPLNYNLYCTVHIRPGVWEIHAEVNRRSECHQNCISNQYKDTGTHTHIHTYTYTHTHKQTHTQTHTQEHNIIHCSIQQLSEERCKKGHCQHVVDSMVAYHSMLSKCMNIQKSDTCVCVYMCVCVHVCVYGVEGGSCF